MSSNPSSDPRTIFLLESGHAPLLTDRVRMDAFNRAIQQSVKPGMRVLDAGCGTGILSMLAARAGALHVTAMERDPALAALARDLVRANRMDKVITVHCGDAADPPGNESYDLIISETAGHLLFDEELLRLRVALQSRLTADGCFLPAAVRMFAVPVHSSVWQEQSSPLKSVAGFDYSLLLQQYAHTPVTLPLDRAELLCPPEMIFSLDLSEVPGFPRTAEIHFDLPAGENCNGMGLFFELDLTDHVCVSTDPRQTPTHWRQGFLPLLDPTTGGRLHFRICASTPGLAGLTWSMEHEGVSQHGAAALSLIEPVS